MMRIFFSLTLFTLISLHSAAQYPKDYFRNPMGIPISLAANFGELRPNHWHMGLDIRTNQKQNLPVYASAAGYISHIGVRPESFGRFIIIRHPNGMSTLYAHLNDFYPDLEEYVTAQQYKQERWAIELDFSSKDFPVSKGQFIAYSGNTGGSQGPHLHFEIFDTKSEKRLNPLLFGLPIPDQVPPDLQRLAMYDRSITVYDQSPVFFSLKKTDSGYIIPKIPVIKTGLSAVSFAIQATDRVSGSSNANGIFSAKMYLDDEPQSGFILDSIDYEETVYINAQIDYMQRKKGGSFVQHISPMPGEHGAAYHLYKGDGVIRLTDTMRHLISIEVKDAQGNTSPINFYIQHFDSIPVKRNPVSSQITIPPGEKWEFKKPDFILQVQPGTLYDTARVNYYRLTSGFNMERSDLHQFGDISIPVHEDVKVSIKPNKYIPEEWKDRLVLRRAGGGTSLRRVKLENGWVNASFGDFGVFSLVADTTPPTLSELGRGDTVDVSSWMALAFAPSDNLGELRNFRATLDSQWIRFTNDKSWNWIYKFDERCPYGVHVLTVSVEDFVGNKVSKTWWFKRGPYTPPPPKKKNKSVSSKKKSTAKKPAVKKKGKK
ncbi:MAG: M23 family metallopeptidase [Chitinophagaceae bacterium]|nr:M23 family metallopeptidase [Chitinophagaceae bacterium]